MTTSASDITIVLSGGSTNINPNNSLGGDPSSTPVVDNVLNNLYADVTSDQSASGFIDYRCIYFFNDGTTPVYSIGIWVEEDTVGGADPQLGVQSQDEIQRISLSGAVITGGSFTLSYKEIPFTSDYNSDLSVWATNLQDTLNTLTDIGDNLFFDEVEVIAQTTGPGEIFFDCLFGGLDVSRALDQFVIVSNDLTPTSGITLVVSTMTHGGPINTIAPEINVSTTPPGGVSFVATSQITPITLPALYPGEGFPLWIQRSTTAGTSALADDLLTVRFKAESLKP